MSRLKLITDTKNQSYKIHFWKCEEVLIVTIHVTSSQWLVNLKPAVEDAVAVEGVGGLAHARSDAPVEAM